MNKRLSALIVVLTGMASALVCRPACRTDEPPRPGRLAAVTMALEKNGKVWSKEALSWLLEREAVGHLMFMATDPRGGTGGGGWYRPSQCRYDWEWLRKRLDQDGDGAISFKEFAGPRDWFEALDKNRDGSLTQDDFDWSGDSAWPVPAPRPRRCSPRSTSIATARSAPPSGSNGSTAWAGPRATLRRMTSCRCSSTVARPPPKRRRGRPRS